LEKFSSARAFNLGWLREAKHPYDLIEELKMEEKCEYCEAILWKRERKNRNTPCCNNGEIKMKSVNWLEMYDSQKAQGQYSVVRNDEVVFRRTMMESTTPVRARSCTHEQFNQDVYALRNLFYDPKFWDYSRQ
jgi:hypothetical protein